MFVAIYSSRCYLSFSSNIQLHAIRRLAWHETMLWTTTDRPERLLLPRRHVNGKPRRAKIAAEIRNPLWCAAWDRCCNAKPVIAGYVAWSLASMGSPKHMSNEGMIATEWILNSVDIDSVDIGLDQFEMNLWCPFIYIWSFCFLIPALVQSKGLTV